MKSKILAIVSISLLLGTIVMAQRTGLPKVEILGSDYYYYEVKKGDILFNICKDLNWDSDKVLKLNPAAGGKLTQGMKIYYPVENGDDKEVIRTSEDQPKSKDTAIVHKVKRGETVYALSRMYGIPVEKIYESYPSSRHGIKAGETIVINQVGADDDGEFAYYTVKSGDTLYRLAKQYNTTVESILSLNPGVSERNFKSGSVVKVKPGSAADNTFTETVTEQKISGFSTYKVKKGDTWQDIADKTGSSVTELREANIGMNIPEKNAVIAVPQTDTISVVKEFIKEDPREKSAAGIRELYEEVNNVEGRGVSKKAIKAVVLLADPASNKDKEFSRGFLIALYDLKRKGIKAEIVFEKGTGLNSDGSLSDVLADADIVITTADNGIPVELAEILGDKKIELVNAFDLKGDLYETCPAVIQLLPPSGYFNDLVAENILDQFGSRKILLVECPDYNDNVVEILTQTLPESQISRLSVEELASYPFADFNSYMVYFTGTRKEDVEEGLGALASALETSAAGDVAVVGRPNWVTLTDRLGDKFKNTGVIIPSRFYYDDSQGEGRTFSRDYNTTYGFSPSVSFPNYAAYGYDVASVFIPGIAYNGGDFNLGLPDVRTVQTDIRLTRPSNWSGLFNSAVYFVKFTPYGVEKVILE